MHLYIGQIIKKDFVKEIVFNFYKYGAAGPYNKECVPDILTDEDESGWFDYILGHEFDLMILKLSEDEYFVGDNYYTDNWKIIDPLNVDKDFKKNMKILGLEGPYQLILTAENKNVDIIDEKEGVEDEKKI